MLKVRHSETATHTIAKMIKCKDCKAVKRVVRNARWSLGWEQVELEAPVMFLGQYTKWVDARGKLARVACDKCTSINTSANIIRATLTEQECNDKCMSATGPACECSCNGENHGSNH